MTTTKTNQNHLESYQAQTSIVKQALATPGHALNDLLKSMRSTGQAAVYFSGTRLDHDYCFGSEDIGILFSVLPEDGQKAAEPGYHPGSTEVYVTFQGSLTVEYLVNNQIKSTLVQQAQPLILPAGRCHRIRQSMEKAASVVIKTNLSHAPGVIRCDACGYFTRAQDCPLHQSWIVERKG